MIYGLLLITLGIVSAWLFYLVGETDVTGSFFFLLAGLYQITDVVKKFILTCAINNDNVKEERDAEV